METIASRLRMQLVPCSARRQTQIAQTGLRARGSQAITTGLLSQGRVFKT